MDKYNQGMHDLLNHLRDQPTDLTAYGMVMVAQAFIAEYEMLQDDEKYV